MGSYFEGLPVYKATADLVVRLDRTVRGFSRYHKYTLGARQRETAAELVLLVARANRREQRARFVASCASGPRIFSKRSNPMKRPSYATPWLIAALGLLASAWSAQASAPAGRYTLSVDTVYDTKTKLTWQRATPGATYDWPGAKSYCQGLTLGGYSSGWRLPTIQELSSLVDVASFNPAIDKAAFPGTPVGRYWSSSPNARYSGAWTVTFDYGNATHYNTTDSYPVRCVR